MAQHRCAGAAARPVLTRHLRRATVRRRTGENIVAVRRTLRINRPALLVERGVVVDVRLVGMKLGDVLCDQYTLHVVPRSGANAVARIDTTGAGRTEVGAPRSIAGTGGHCQRLATLVGARQAAEIT